MTNEACGLRSLKSTTTPRSSIIVPRSKTAPEWCACAAEQPTRAVAATTAEAQPRVDAMGAYYRLRPTARAYRFLTDPFSTPAGRLARLALASIKTKNERAQRANP